MVENISSLEPTLIPNFKSDTLNHVYMPVRVKLMNRSSVV